MVNGSNTLKLRTIERFDRSKWRQYESAQHIFYLTGTGRQLLLKRGINHILRSYIEDFASDRTHDGPTRKFLAEGANSKVYSAGDDLVVKESKANGTSLWPALERMDRLFDAVQKHCPRWIDIPDHYGLMVSKQDTTQEFLLMQKIDHGVTAGDVININNPSEDRATNGKLEPGSLLKFGSISGDLQDEVSSRYKELQIILRKAIIAEYLDPNLYLPDIDYNPHNVVLEKQKTPVADSYLKYWVIDQ